MDILILVALPVSVGIEIVKKIYYTLNGVDVGSRELAVQINICKISEMVPHLLHLCRRNGAVAVKVGIVHIVFQYILFPVHKGKRVYYCVDYIYVLKIVPSVIIDIHYIVNALIKQIHIGIVYKAVTVDVKFHARRVNPCCASRRICRTRDDLLFSFYPGVVGLRRYNVGLPYRVYHLIQGACYVVYVRAGIPYRNAVQFKTPGVISPLTALISREVRLRDKRAEAPVRVVIVELGFKHRVPLPGRTGGYRGVDAACDIAAVEVFQFIGFGIIGFQPVGIILYFQTSPVAFVISFLGRVIGGCIFCIGADKGVITVVLASGCAFVIVGGESLHLEVLYFLYPFIALFKFIFGFQDGIIGCIERFREIYGILLVGVYRPAP